MLNQYSEAKSAEEFMTNPENTMSQVLSNSVGMVLLRLKDIYLQNATDEEITQHYDKTCEELDGLAKEDTTNTRQASLKNIISIIDANLDKPPTQLDMVTLSLSNHEEPTCFVFRLKEIITLIWMALNDDEKFIKNYARQDEDKLEQAKKDRHHRIDSFFIVLDRIKKEQPCNTGIRHELVFLLNETYENVHLIEDAQSAVCAFLKENIHQYFWERYNQESLSTEQKQALTKVLFEWMMDANPETVLQILDCKDKLYDSLGNYFLEHGSNYISKELHKLIEQVLPYLEFSCDPKKYPILDQIHWILSANEIKENKTASTALAKMQRWILQTYQLQDEEDQKKLRGFYFHYRAYEKLHRYHLLLVITGKWNHCQKLLQACEQYFHAFTGIESETINVAETIIDEIITLDATLNSCKKETMADQIENFFIQWFKAKVFEKVGKETLQTLYGMLLNQEIRTEKILLNDKEIQAFIESNQINSEGIIEITPYLINRIFLHAILTQPQAWTELFYTAFNLVLKFVENSFNKSNNERTMMLKQDSYPPALLGQLAYLEACRREVSGKTTQVDIPRPRRMILLPKDVRTIEEWRFVVFLLEEKELTRVYDRLRAKIDPILINAFALNAVSLEDILLVIPTDHRLSFITKHGNQLIQNGYQLTAAIKILQRFEKESSKVLEFTKHHAQKIGNILQLENVFEELRGLIRSADQYLEFVSEFVKEIEERIICDEFVTNSHEYLCLINVLKTAQAQSLFKFAKIHAQKIENIRRFADVLEKLKEAEVPAEQLLEFVQYIDCEKIFQDGLQLDCFIKSLQTLPPLQLLEFVKTHAQIIKDGNDFADTLSQLRKATVSAEQLLAFAQQHNQKIEDAQQLAHVLDILEKAKVPTEQLLEFAQHFLRDELIIDGWDVVTATKELQTLPEQKLKFANNHIQKIKNAQQLAHVFEILEKAKVPTEQLLEFAQHFLRDELIKNGWDVVAAIEILQTLPKPQLLEFAKLHKEKIVEGAQLTGVLEVLNKAEVSAEQCLQLTQDFPKCSIRFTYWLVEVLKQLRKAKASAKELLEFTKLHTLDIRDTRDFNYTFAAVLKQLQKAQVPAVQLLEFTKCYAPQIIDNYDKFAAIIEVLGKANVPAVQLLEFAKSYTPPIIKNCEELAAIIEVLGEANVPAVQLLEFTNLHAYVIRDAKYFYYDFTAITEALSKAKVSAEQYLQFAKPFYDERIQIENDSEKEADQFWFVRSVIFAELEKTNIPKAQYLEHIKNKYAWLIQDGILLANTIYTLSSESSAEQCLQFAKYYAHTIKNDEQFHILLDVLKMASVPAEQLNEFTQYYSQKINADLFIAAAKEDDIEKLKNYLSLGVDVNARESSIYKATALHFASISGKEEIVKLLLENGADAKAKDAFGNIPFQWAEKNNEKEICELLSSWRLPSVTYARVLTTDIGSSRAEQLNDFNYAEKDLTLKKNEEVNNWQKMIQDNYKEPVKQTIAEQPSVSEDSSSENGSLCSPGN